MAKHVLRFFTFFVVLYFSGNLSAQSQKELGSLMRNRDEYYFTLKVDKPSEINYINSICSVDGTDGATVVGYANTKEYEALLKAGYQPTLLTPPSLREEAKMWDGNRATYEWDSYLTYEQYVSMMEGFPTATVTGRSCTLIDLGTLATSNHRKLLGVRINNGQAEGKPKFLYTSTMHGDEVTGMILMLRLINELCTSTETRIVNLVNNLDIYIFPLTNPDGTYYGGNNTVTGARRYNGNGVDLNRNYKDYYQGDHPDNNAYAEETIWTMQLGDENLFTMSANYHGGAEVMNYPWDAVYDNHADKDWYEHVCTEYVQIARQTYSSYMSDTYSDGVTSGAEWYVITGSRQDYMNAYAQCREVTIECSTAKTPSASQLPNFWNYNHNSMLAFMEQSLNGIHGFVYDEGNGQPIQGVKVTVQDHDSETSFVTTHSAGDFHRPITGGSYTLVFTKSGYCPKTVEVTVEDDQRVELNDIKLTPGNCMMPAFSANTTEVAIGQSISFTDGSFGDIATWRWTFEGATPASSTQQNPTGITYNTAGDFDVTLVITDADGHSETLIKENYIHVTSSYLMQNGSVTTCDALFYDSGGANGNYGDNQDYTMTFYPSAEDAKVQVTFNSFELESNWDFLYIYDGTSTSATPIGDKYTGTNSPGTVTATNSAGSLTFRFTSDSSVGKSGWVATVSCDYPSYNITATADPQEGGVIEGADTYEQGDLCTLTATPAAGYAFVGWTENGTELGSDNPYTFEVTANRDLVAHFEEVSTLHWEAAHTLYADNMTLCAVIQIDGEEQYRNTLEVGVFVGEECRASDIARLFPFNNRYILNLVIAGQDGESFSFRLYDHEQDAELTPALHAPASISFNNDGYGSPINPYTLNFGAQGTAQQNFQIVNGWIWWSSYITFDENSLDEIQNQVDAASASVTIKSSDSFTGNLDGAWSGTLDHLDNTNMYLIASDRSLTLTLEGQEVDPSELILEVKPGWNWICYPLSQAMDLETAFGNFTPEEGDAIKSQYAFSSYSDGTWQGTLRKLEPGKGYIYCSKRTQSIQLIFPTITK